MNKKLDRKTLVKRLDTLCSYIARNTYDYCASCSKPLEYKQRQWGHAFPRGCTPLRWEECHHVQAACCNLYRDGNYIMYHYYLKKEYGVEQFDKWMKTYVDHKKGKIKPFKIGELRDTYNDKLAEARAIHPHPDAKPIPKTWKEEL